MKLSHFVIILMITLFCFALMPLKANDIPTRRTLSITSAAATAVQIGDWQNGQLAKLKVYNVTPTNAVLTVSQIYTLGDVPVTNTIATVAGASTTDCTAEFLLPGDYLSFQFNAATTGIVEYILLVPK